MVWKHRNERTQHGLIEKLPLSKKDRCYFAQNRAGHIEVRRTNQRNRGAKRTAKVVLRSIPRLTVTLQLPPMVSTSPSTRVTRHAPLYTSKKVRKADFNHAALVQNAFERFVTSRATRVETRQLLTQLLQPIGGPEAAGRRIERDVVERKKRRFLRDDLRHLVQKLR